MQSGYEASILTQARNRGSDRHRRGHDRGKKAPIVGSVVVALLLMLIVGWSQATRSGLEGGSREAANSDNPMIDPAQRPNAAHSGGAAFGEGEEHIGRTKPPLFLGHVEFDWDPTGGVAGFGPWPPLRPPAGLAAADRVER